MFKVGDKIKLKQGVILAVEDIIKHGEIATVKEVIKDNDTEIVAVQLPVFTGRIWLDAIAVELVEAI